ncbi:MAG: aldehyde dehydrogenase family protein [Myxococcota bacterium]
MQPELPSIQGTCPVDLKPLPKVAITSAAEVSAAVARAKAAQPGWVALGFEARAALLKQAAKRMVERREDVVALMREEVGKYPADVLMSEALAPLDSLLQWIGIAKKALAPRPVGLNPVAFPGKKARVELEPRGVIGVIAPWNFPLAYFMKPLYPALLAGNTVVLKPSELAPRMAEWLTQRLQEFLPSDVVQCVVGGPETGRALIKGGIDGLVFTGSVQTGKEVMRACAEAMIPLSAELGGKDPAIVLPDCNLDRTVAGILHWSFTNAGQSCSSIERIYVHERIADRFVAMLADAASRLATEPREDGSVDIGPLIDEKLLLRVESQVADAVRDGARVLCGGRRTGRGYTYRPTVLDRVHHGMRIAKEEIFGPVVCVIRVPSAEEAIRLANDSSFGLNASVWSENIAEAEKIGARLEAGVVLINNHSVTGAMPALPWSGVKQTGYGIANSAHSFGLFTRPKTYLIDTNKGPDAWWLPMDAALEEMGDRLAEAQLGRVLKAIPVPFLMGGRKKTIERFIRGERAWSLTDLERKWGAQIYESIFPRSADPVYGAKTKHADPEADLDQLLKLSPAMTGLGIRAAIWMHGLAPLVLKRELKTFDMLDETERFEIVDRLAKSQTYLIRQSAFLLKTSGALSMARTSHLRPLKES